MTAAAGRRSRKAAGEASRKARKARKGRGPGRRASALMDPMGVDELSDAVRRLGERLAGMGAPEEELKHLEVALEELGSNAILHGGADAGCLRARMVKDGAVAFLSDNGRPFDAAEAVRDASAPPDPAKGGHGLIMVRAFCAKVSWRRRRDENVTAVRVPFSEG